MSGIFQLQRSTPEAQGISSAAVADFIHTAENTIQSLHSFMLLRHGRVVAEGWWYPWRAEAPHELYSLSKSFTSSAIGLAVAERRLTVQDDVLSFFPEYAPKHASANLKKMKVHHLLSMSTGHDQDTSERVFYKRDPIKAFLSLPVEHLPGTHFVYNSAASFMLAAIIQRLTSQNLMEYLTPRIFEPLGIVGASWDSHPCGINFGGWGLNIKTEDIARFGQLYLQKGQWGGKQIIPDEWVELATAKQVSNGDDPQSDWAQGYGYQFWRCRHHIYRGDGAFGQFCIVMPEQDTVIAITAGVADMQSVLNVVWEKLLPAMQEDRLPENEEESGSLASKLKNLAIAPPECLPILSDAVECYAQTYSFEPNYETLHSIRFDFNPEAAVMTYRLLGGGVRRGIHRLEIGHGTWREGISYLGGGRPQRVAVAGAWTAKDIFMVRVCQYETPFILTITCQFKGEQLLYDTKVNLSFIPIDRPQLTGTSA
jgi:CubicO group peptidase (beta-lactamase class C family)